MSSIFLTLFSPEISFTDKKGSTFDLMKFKRYIPLFISLFIVLGLMPLQSVHAENLLENADFSELDDENLPVFWYTDAYVQDTAYTSFEITDADSAHPHAAVIHNFGKNDARFVQSVEVEPNSLYLLSGDIRADEVEGGHGANLSVEGVYQFSEKLYDTEGQWKHIEYYGETGPEQDYITVYARLGGYSGESTGKAWFSNLSLTKVDEIPGDLIADSWYTESIAHDDDENDTEDEIYDTNGTFRPWFILIVAAYTAAAVFAFLHFRENDRDLTEEKRCPKYTAAFIFLAGLALRIIISCLVEGYMVDVNCFLSWGQTMAAVGPAGFYEATNFCDYPPLYTYVLALNSIVTSLAGGGQAAERIVFRLVPSVCDLIGCWLVYRIMLRREGFRKSACLVLLAFAVFNPAAILNSAAWGQMDSVLCLLLLGVAVCAVKSQWIAALPLYVAAVLIKPQALMLGPLGLIYIIFTYIRQPERRKAILTGTGIAVVTMAAGILPFSPNQNWDWLIQLYFKTLSSYPYATLNTANFFYLMGGNWAPVGNAAPMIVFIIPAVLCLLYGYAWQKNAVQYKSRIVETIICILFALAFGVCAVTGMDTGLAEYAKDAAESVPLLPPATWTYAGILTMAFTFVIVISHVLRSGSLKLLPWLGGLLYILLYVFGLKMHERYIFPALLLLYAAFALLKEKRILYVALLFTVTTFLNEGIILDNSIRLGSSLGHLNNDTVMLADFISIVNIIGALYATMLSLEFLLKQKIMLGPCSKKVRTLLDWKTDRNLYWNRKDTFILTLITVIYAAVSLLTLGSTKAPQTCWTSSSASEQIVFDLGDTYPDVEVLYFGQVSRDDFTFASSTDGKNWSDEVWAQMDEGQCWKWKYLSETYIAENGRRAARTEEMFIIRFRCRFIRLTAGQIALRLNEIIFRDAAGNIIPATVLSHSGAERESQMYSDPGALLDEQDTLEGLPAFTDEQLKIQPSWWNSTYFDEIYHARTAYEFVKGTVPYETSHPPLGKVIMSFFVSVFGMTPFGWRFAGALAGILMLPGMYLLGKQITKKTGIATLVCLIMALDCMHLTQTQIATIDSFPVLFIIFAYLFMLRFIQTDFIREKLSASLTSLGFSGLFMGLSIASKWIGIYAGAGLAVLFFWHCFRTAAVYRKAGKTVQAGTDETEDPDEENQRIMGMFPKPLIHSAFRRITVLCLWCVLFFILVPVAIYLLSYIPYFAYNSKRIQTFWDYLNEVWRAQIGMINYHSQPGLGMDHPYYSPWWEWPVIGKPMWYASDQYVPENSPVFYSIFCFGNPVIWFGGLAAMLVSLFRMAINNRYLLQDHPHIWHLKSGKYDHAEFFILVGLLAQYLPWILVPRGTYIYHYFASIPFLMIATGMFFNMGNLKTRRYFRIAAVIYLIAAAAFFIILFPYASGIAVSPEWLHIGSSILKIWY